MAVEWACLSSIIDQLSNFLSHLSQKKEKQNIIFFGFLVKSFEFKIILSLFPGQKLTGNKRATNTFKLGLFWAHSL